MHEQFKCKRLYIQRIYNVITNFIFNNGLQHLLKIATK